MKQLTWSLINQKYQRFRSYYGEPVDDPEFDSKFESLPVSPDYREFVQRYGGGLVGSYPIYGLCLPEAMGLVGRKGTAPEITRVFRDRGWPGVNDWLVFSVDQSGNPVGLSADGSIWISDGAMGQIQKLSDSFEDFLIEWGLRVKDQGDTSNSS